MKAVTSAYSNIEISDTAGAVTILAYRTGWHFGGHTHLAFEYPDQYGFANTGYRHVVFHLVALGGQSGQNCSGTSAAVLKQVPVGDGRYGFVGGEGALKKATQRLAKSGKEMTEELKGRYGLKDLGNWERNMPNNAEWCTSKFRSKGISVPPAVAKKGHLLCRKVAKGNEVEGLESSRFHKLSPAKGTNCVRFALSVLRLIDVHPNWVMKFYALTSPPEAVRRGRLLYVVPN